MQRRLPPRRAGATSHEWSLRQTIRHRLIGPAPKPSVGRAYRCNSTALLTGRPSNACAGDEIPRCQHILQASQPAAVARRVRDRKGVRHRPQPPPAAATRLLAAVGLPADVSRPPPAHLPAAAPRLSKKMTAPNCCCSWALQRATICGRHSWQTCWLRRLPPPERHRRNNRGSSRNSSSRSSSSSSRGRHLPWLCACWTTAAWGAAAAPLSDATTAQRQWRRMPFR